MSLVAISFAQINVTLGTVTMQATDVGSVVNVPVIVTQGASGIGSMQFKVSYDGTVLSPVSQSATNQGLINPLPATIPGGSWYAGVQSNAISPNWFDGTFTGITIANGDTLFKLQFTYNGGSSSLNFDATNCFVYDVNYSPFTLNLSNGAVMQQAPAQDMTLSMADFNLTVANIGDTIDVPVQVVYGDSNIGSIQLEISFNNSALSLVQQSPTNVGLVNAAAITLANGGDWVAGASTGSSIVCTWFDPLFAGIELMDNTVLFELRFVYLGGSSALDFNANNSFVFDALYSPITVVYDNGTMTGSGVPAMPMAYTFAATSATYNSIDLNGAAVANNALTIAYFEYGSDTNYGDTAYAVQSPVSDSMAVSAPVSGLMANSTYHFRLVCENNIGMAYGQDMTFTTATAPANMLVAIDDYDATGMALGSIINVPVIATMGYNGVGSMQFSILYDSLVLTPVVQSVTNVGLTNLLAATTANGGEWLSGISNQTINCNWFDPSFSGINILTGDTLFELQFTYIGGNSDLEFGISNYVYDNAFMALNVDYTNGSVSAQPVVTIADLVITEIMYNPPESGTDSLEFIEVYNKGAAADLSGYYFSDGVEGNFPSIVLTSGEYLLFAVDSVAFENNFGLTAYQWTSGALSNSGESIEISAPNATVVDYVNFDDNSPWPTSPDGNGPSLTLCDPSSDNAVAANWSASTEATSIIDNGIEILATPGAGCYVAPSYDVAVSISDMNLGVNDIGTTINIPVVMDLGYNGIGSMQFEVSYDPAVLTPVMQSATNVGLINPASETTANNGDWFAGNGSGSSIVCNWFDPTFAGINMTSGTTVFELQFTYLGGSSALEFNTSNSFVYDPSFNLLSLDLSNATLTGAQAPAMPMAYTQAATAITHNEAMLNGIAVANNAVTTTYFEYGTNVNYGDTAFIAQSPVNDSTMVSTMAMNLAANTEYHFRLVCENSYGTSYGQDMSFTTSSAPAEMEISIANFDATGISAGSIINVPVVADMGYNGVGSMQFSITYNNQVLTPVVQSLTLVGLTNPLAATTANGGEWLSGIFSQTINCNWFDPLYTGINITSGDTLFELQFTYLGGVSDLNFGSSNYVYNAAFAAINVDYNNGSVYEFVIPDQELFFSEYIEGSSNNKALEIYNPTSLAVNLSDYLILQTSNGSDWIYIHTFPAGATLAASSTWVMVSDQISLALYDTTLADEVLAFPELVYFNGDDARALAKIVNGDTVIIDVIGEAGYDPGTGWAVAGVANATLNHTLIRKSTIQHGNSNWASSAGTDANNSEWIVEAQNTIDLGNFISVNLEFDIADVTYTSTMVGDTVNIPVVITAGNTGIASMQLEISFDAMVLQPVMQSVTNTGIVNPAAATSANNGEWFAGTGTGSSISCNWFDPTFAGIELTSGSTLFELQFVYLGGSSSIDFNTNNCYAYDPAYNAINTNYLNGSVSGDVASAPLAITEGTSNITDISASLTGTISANNALTVAYFEFGLSNSYGDTAYVAQNPVNSTLAVSADINGLMPNTMYHYRLVAENAYGLSYGADSTFTTSAAPADMMIQINDFDATMYSPGDTIEIPVTVLDGYNGVSSMQFSIQFDPAILTPVVISITNSGIYNPAAVTTANGGDWISGAGADSIISCNWFDPLFLGIDLQAGTTMFELQFVYHGGESAIEFLQSSSYVYDAAFSALQVEYIDGNLTGVNFQTINLPVGWSIWSTYMIPGNPNIATVFAPLGSEVILVKNGNGQVYWPLFGLNAIGNLAIGEGYQAKMNTSQTLDIYGIPVVPELSPVSLPMGWSIVGYLRANPANVVDMLSGIVSEIAIVKDGNGAVYWPAFNVNMIGNMMTGKGYQIKVNSQVVLTYPANSVSTVSSSKMETITQYYGKAINTGNNMTVCFPASSWQNVPTIGSEIAVKDANGAIVGSSVFSGNNTAITIWGDDDLSAETDGLFLGEDLHFYLWNPATGTEQLVQVDIWQEGQGYYETNGIAVIGKLAPVSSINNFSFNVYPNPFVSSAKIDLSLQSAGRVKIELYDEAGRLVQLIADTYFDKGQQSLEIDAANLPAGNYQIKIQTAQQNDSKFIVRIR